MKISQVFGRYSRYRRRHLLNCLASFLRRDDHFGQCERVRCVAQASSMAPTSGHGITVRVELGQDCWHG